jgi:hypothetical protein
VYKFCGWNTMDQSHSCEANSPSVVNVLVFLEFYGNRNFIIVFTRCDDNLDGQDKSLLGCNAV